MFISGFVKFLISYLRNLYLLRFIRFSPMFSSGIFIVFVYDPFQVNIWVWRKVKKITLFPHYAYLIVPRLFVAKILLFPMN